MSFDSWLQNLRSALAPGPRQRQHRRRGSRRAAMHRPCLEILEDRLTPSFSPAVSYAAGLGPQAVVTADFNHDGKLDLAIVNYGSSDVSILLGNADGTFQPALTSATGGSPLSLAVGDFNADGTLDLATANAEGTVSVLLGIKDGSGKGTGTFGAPTNIDLGSSPSKQSVAVGDFNGDGLLDLGVTSNVYNPGFYGPGSWGGYYGNYYYPGTWYPGSYEGRANVLLGNADPQGQADGTFAPPIVTSLGTRYHTSAAAANLNGDGFADFVTFNADYGYGDVLLGDSSGYLQYHSEFYTGYYSDSVAAGDVNGDGRIDLVTGNSSGNNVSVLLGDGAGNFSAPGNYATGGWPSSLVLGDFTGDGHVDVATTNYYSDDVSVLRGAGDGTFLSAVHAAVSSYPVGVAVGDFNGDHFPDLAVANSGSNTVSVLLNTQDWRSLFGSAFPSPTTAGDAHSITVSARDTGGNVLTGYTGTVHFASSDPQAVLPADYVFTTNDHGSHTFTLTLKTAGSQWLTVTDTTTADFTWSQEGIAVNPGTATHFVVAGLPSTMTSGDTGYFSVSAYDAYGNLATNYTGTVHFTSSDTSATLPADYTFTPYNYGTAYFSATLGTAGTQSIIATDTLTLSATGTERDPGPPARHDHRTVLRCPQPGTHVHARRQRWEQLHLRHRLEQRRPRRSDGERSEQHHGPAQLFCQRLLHRRSHRDRNGRRARLHQCQSVPNSAGPGRVRDNHGGPRRCEQERPGSRGHRERRNDRAQRGDRQRGGPELQWRVGGDHCRPRRGCLRAPHHLRQWGQ